MPGSDALKNENTMHLTNLFWNYYVHHHLLIPVSVVTWAITAGGDQWQKVRAPRSEMPIDSGLQTYSQN